MAEIQATEADGKSRKRKANFSINEISIITENVRKHIDTLQSKLTNNVSNKRKNVLWEEITTAVNAVGCANRSTQEVKDKWKNLHSTAKKEFSQYRRDRKKTGGEPVPKAPSLASEQIIDLLENTPAFAGLKGFETVDEAGETGGE